MVEKRDSTALLPELIADPVKKAEAESENGLRQYDLAMDILEQALDPDYPPFKLTTAIILQLQQKALEGISPYAGTYRPGGVVITGSLHEPPDNFHVPQLLEEMCQYVNEHWVDATALHLSSYIMWRLNWIHPFADGNGRTSRTVSYLVLCAALKTRLSGTITIPELIADKYRDNYYEALGKIDLSLKENEQFDLFPMEDYLESLLSKQLLSVVEDARGD